MLPASAFPESATKVKSRSSAASIPVAGRENRLDNGDHLGAKAIAGRPHKGTVVQFLERIEVCRLALEAVEDLPIVRWKLVETHRHRYLRT